MDRLASFRALEGLTQAQMGELLGVSDKTISRIEKGLRPLTSDTDPTGYSQYRFETLASMSEPLHRQKSATRESARQRAKEILRLGGEIFGLLAERTAKAPVQILQPISAPSQSSDVEDLAQQVRSGALRHESLGRLRDLTAAVERAGICLVPIRDLPGVDGLSSWVGNVPVIGIDPCQPGDRFRFTLAHEIGHLTMHRSKSDSTESEANRFAGSLLMPRHDVEKAFEEKLTLSDLLELKRTWGLSVAALTYRARELNLIDEKRYRSFQIQMANWRKSEPEKFEAAPGRLLPKLIEVNGGAQSVAKQLGFNLDHVRLVAQWSSQLRLVRSA